MGEDAGEESESLGPMVLWSVLILSHLSLWDAGAGPSQGPGRDRDWAVMPELGPGPGLGCDAGAGPGRAGTGTGL